MVGLGNPAAQHVVRSAQRIRSKAVDGPPGSVNGGTAQHQGLDPRPIMDACPLLRREWNRIVHDLVLISWCGMNFIGLTNHRKPQKIVIGFA
jgi:hypothetical protein